MRKRNDSLPKAVQDCHQIVVWLIPVLDRFPRSRRFTLGERLESRLLDDLGRQVCGWLRSATNVKPNPGT